jgi:hypothetical protein
VVSDQLGHSSIVLTADTCISVLPALTRKAAEDTAKLIAKAGRCAPGSKHPRHRAAPIRARVRPPREAASPTPPAATTSNAPLTATPCTPTSPARWSRAERISAGKEVTAA